MRNTFLFLSTFLFLVFVLNGCSEDDGISGDNWAGAVEGTYVGTIDYCNDEDATILITRIEDKRLNIKVDFDYFCGSSTSSHRTYCMDSVTMTSQTTFTINEHEGCSGFSSNATGGGNFSGNTVSFSVRSDDINATRQ